MNPNDNLPPGTLPSDIARSAGRDEDEICSEPGCHEFLDSDEEFITGLCEKHLRIVIEGLPE